MPLTDKNGFNKLKRNPNLTYSRYSHFQGYPVIQNKGPLVVEYLEKTKQLMDKALADQPDTVLLRIEMRFPYWITPDDVQALGTDLISRFWASLKAQLVSCASRCYRQGEDIPWPDLRYLWCKEATQSDGKPHYHAALFLSRVWIERLSLNGYPVQLEAMLKEAWGRAIGVPVYEAPGILFLPPHAVYDLSPDKQIDAYASAFYRLSYLTKTATKRYDDGSQWFGYSRS